MSESPVLQKDSVNELNTVIEEIGTIKGFIQWETKFHDLIGNETKQELLMILNNFETEFREKCLKKHDDKKLEFVVDTKVSDIINSEALLNLMFNDDSEWNKFKKIFTARLFKDRLKVLCDKINKFYPVKEDDLGAFIVLLEESINELETDKLVFNFHIQINKFIGLFENDEKIRTEIANIMYIASFIDFINQFQLGAIERIDSILCKYIDQ
ncbi:hypothetical protein TVAG_161020 [Trichomonas vaginalis G3]|uniref:Uncharacterized protein n=1 Tax=Trichomonas vaginalis (strain ATCC PRA-98 / G3) TaxID=412133 RepID=A2E4V7_TRIV3|nr:hypothetical protein TVAGG3_0228000 [Trichomonas vaginalis G3]EAY12296.1 hypothetical protein TVAG_161020 [Trichomonas vaginalis G3]KAI5552410.1 hypothetical protein TVAGG3_0228000 [Trichomonas vaginalis G3]|eukprot:XP_001324519.1 hypothetical protein [Trichomonas vaginalis G3]